MKFSLFLDSRSSQGYNPSQCVWALQETIVGAVECKILSFNFCNTLNNVQSANTLVFSTVTVPVPPGNYSGACVASWPT